MTEAERNALLARLADGVERLERVVVETGQKLRMDQQVLHQRVFVLGERVTTLERRLSAIEGDVVPAPPPSMPLPKTPREILARAISELLDAAAELDKEAPNAG